MVADVLLDIVDSDAITGDAESNQSSEADPELPHRYVHTGRHSKRAVAQRHPIS